MSRTEKRKHLTAAALFALAGGMVGLAFASAPLYRLFCQVTGYGGTPKVATDAPRVPSAGAGGVITVRFDANTNAALPWAFEPETRRVTVKLGEPVLAFYRARNRGDGAVTGTATYNVSPYKAGQYFSKIDCFCFTEQTLGPGETASMPVEFVVDPEILTDPNTRELRTITLSYTFFPADGGDAPDNTKTLKTTRLEIPDGRR